MGSLILGGNLNIHTLEGNCTVIPLKYAADFADISGLESLSADSLDVQMGYAFLYAWEHFYLNLNVIAGPGIQNKRLVFSDQNLNKEEVQSVYNGQGFIGVSYYDQELQVGVRSKFKGSQSELAGVKYTQEITVNYLYFLLIF